MMSEVAVSHPVEGILSTEGAPHPAAVQENPDDTCRDMGTTRGASIAREKKPEGDRAAELGRHVEAAADGYMVQAAGSSGAEVSGRECPVEVPNGEQETKPREVYGRESPVKVPEGEQVTKPSSEAAVCTGEAGSDPASSCTDPASPVHTAASL